MANVHVHVQVKFIDLFLDEKLNMQHFHKINVRIISVAHNILLTGIYITNGCLLEPCVQFQEVIIAG